MSGEGFVAGDYATYQEISSMQLPDDRTHGEHSAVDDEAPLPAPRTNEQLLTDQLADAREEIAFWRRDAVARAWGAAAQYHAADSVEEQAHIKVGQLDPALHAIRDADAKDYHWSCEGWGKPVLTGHHVVQYEDAGPVHADCEDPAGAYLDEHVTVYADGFSEAEMAKMLEFARSADKAPLPPRLAVLLPGDELVKRLCSQRCAVTGDPPCYELNGSGPVDKPFVWDGGQCGCGGDLSCKEIAALFAPAVIAPQ